MRNLARHERVWNDTDRMSAGGKDGVGENSHESDAATTEHQADAAGHHRARQIFRGLAVDGRRPTARAAEDTDATERWHGPIIVQQICVRLTPHRPAVGYGFRYATNLYPRPWTVMMYCGWRGLSSSFWRSHATCTSTVRVDGIAL